jgi:hypothetical protein
MKEDNIIFQIAGTITKLSTMAHGMWRINIDTQENITSEDVTKLSNLKDKVGWFTMVHRKNDGKIEAEDLLDMTVKSRLKTYLTYPNYQNMRTLKRQLAND